MATIKEYFDLQGVRTNVMPTPKEMGLVISTELIGIEVEVENVLRLVTNPTLWQLVNDGSLRNAGKEFITPPIPANRAEDALNELLGKVLEKQCSFSPRTSVHLHLNVQDLDTDQVANLMMVYILYERQFFRFVGRARIKNPYCVPLIAGNMLRHWLRDGIKCRWEKYSGFNLLPLKDKGTIEFRHMHGTFNVDKLVRWVDLIVSLKEYVKKVPTKEIRKRLSNITPEEVMNMTEEVFPRSHRSLEVKELSELRHPIAMMKYAMANRANVANLRAKINKGSAFFTIKGN